MISVEFASSLLELRSSYQALIWVFQYFFIFWWLPDSGGSSTRGWFTLMRELPRVQLLHLVGGGFSVRRIGDVCPVDHGVSSQIVAEASPSAGGRTSELATLAALPESRIPCLVSVLRF